MRFGIVGDPVDHSRSPAMHNAGFAACGIDAVFDYVRTPADRFHEAEELLREGTLLGASVTMPHKANAFAAVDEVDFIARNARAVNTIISTDGVLSGYNTDVDGVHFSIHKLGLRQDTPILLLGYGGAASAALVSFGNERRVTLSGRDKHAALNAAHDVGVDAGFVRWGVGVPQAIVVNATPLGMHGEELPDNILVDAAGLFDMTYGVTETPAIVRARELGLPASDGLDMLVGQAVAAFELFTGVAPPIDVLHAAARGG